MFLRTPSSSVLICDLHRLAGGNIRSITYKSERVHWIAGYFPGAFNGADVTVKYSKRFAGSGAGAFSISTILSQRLRPPRVKAQPQRAYCHIGGAKKGQVWTQFYRLLDK
jgi:hypothetical protein